MIILIASLSASFEYYEKFLNFLNPPAFELPFLPPSFNWIWFKGFQGHIHCIFFEVKPKSLKS